ncbi:MAG: hypothetical protein KAU21_06500, partial [Gammaproteobacteria bacterium]|nr:hypothetical protein [Gammaproteobacteria bacterium]
MPILQSSINTDSDFYRDNTATMTSLVDELREKVAQISLGGSQSAREKYLSRGRLLARDRIQLLLEKVSAVVPVNKLAAHFHDTRGQALANLLAVLQVGVSIIDSSVV